MNDERFDRDLGTVLREIAGEEAPMSLRNRLARIADEAPVGRRLWFAPPMRLAAVAAALVAVVALAIIFVPRESVGPNPSQSPGSPAPSGRQSASPVPSAEPTVTVQPSPDLAWTGLDWTAGVVPFAQNTSWIAEIVPWDDGYVGVGGTFTSSGPGGQGTVFSSPDGQHWTVTYQAELPEGWSFAHVVRLGDGLLAISDQRGVACEANAPCPPEGFDVSPRLWSSSDGTNWAQIDSPSWRDVVGDMPPFDIVGGGAGVVGVRANGTVVHTTDGVIWQLAELPAAATALPGRPAIPGALTAFDGGFVVVGRDGSPDPHSEVVDTPLPPGSGRPAAWFSPNGVEWTEADVPGQVVPGGELREVAAGAEGLFAAGIGEAVDTQTHPLTHGWASVDGMTWTMVGRIGEDVPLFGGSLLAQGFVVGDGSTMVIFGEESVEAATVVAFASRDGVSWTPLSFSGAEAHFVTGYWNEAGPQGARYLTSATVVPDGVIAHIFSGENEFWFGTAVPGPSN